MVLSYFKTPSSQPLILDSYIKKILPSSKRLDLKPIYAFNVLTITKSKKKHTKWDNLIESIKRNKI